LIGLSAIINKIGGPETVPLRRCDKMGLENPNKVIQLLDMLFLGSTSGAGAIAWHTWLGTNIGIRRVIALFVLSALFSVIVYLWTWPSMVQEPTKHFAISILCGIGTTDLVAFTFALIRTRIVAIVGIKKNGNPPD
jgi:hypothetical protein